MQFARRKREELSLNLTPLIDVVFLLLIFFMVSTTFTKETRLTLELPEATGEPVTGNLPDVIEITVSGEGDFAVNGQPLANRKIETLKAAIQKASNSDNSMPLMITGDASAPYQAVVTAMDAAGQLGFVQVNITTQMPQSED